MGNTEIFLYEAKSMRSPDKVEGVVPFEVNEQYIFFGPGETAFRTDLRKRFLSRLDEYKPDGDLYIVGVNEVSSKEQVRKILWVGRIDRVMTFSKAFRLLEEPGFESLQEVRTEEEPGKNNSPLHIEPIDISGRLSGYRHRSDYHSKVGRDGIPDWAKDVADPRKKSDFGIVGDDLLLRDVSLRKDVFRRDCCFLCENVFFARTQGISIDDELVSLLDQWQPGQGVDSVGIFGYSQKRGGSTAMNKHKGSHLHMRWRIAEGIVNYILKNRPKQ